VLRYTKPVARSLVAGAVTIGALDLIAYGAGALLHAEPLGAATRLALAGLAAGVGLVWERFDLDKRLEDRIG
jgi:hypothetical protein